VSETNEHIIRQPNNECTARVSKQYECNEYVRSTKYGVIRVNMSVAISERRDKYAKHGDARRTEFGVEYECNEYATITFCPGLH
jgi:hypothetical protein